MEVSQYYAIDMSISLMERISFTKVNELIAWDTNITIETIHYRKGYIILIEH